MADEQLFYRRGDAGKYLKETYGFGSEKTLAKGAWSGDTPKFHKAGRIVLYTREALDEWAISRISKPHRSTSEYLPKAERLPSTSEQMKVAR
jgi:hypothetical protein